MTDNLMAPPADLLEPELDPNKDYYQELSKPGAKFDRTKYASDEEWKKEISKGKYYADQTIEVMKRRQDELRADYLKLREDNVTKAKLEELLDQLKTQRLTDSEPTPAIVDKPTLNPNEFRDAVVDAVRNLRVEDESKQNFNVVRNKLNEKFGSKAPELLKQRSEELGLSEEDVNALARKSPIAFFKMMGFDQQQTDNFQTPPRSNQRNDNFAPTGSKNRTWAYYQELKKANPNAYFDPKITNQMSEDAVLLGEAFRDGDYYRRGLHEE